MTERLNNDQILQRITDTNSDLKRYLNLAPALKPLPCQPKTTLDSSRTPLFSAQFLRPNFRP